MLKDEKICVKQKRAKYLRNLGKFAKHTCDNQKSLTVTHETCAFLKSNKISLDLHLRICFKYISLQIDETFLFKFNKQVTTIKS